MSQGQTAWPVVPESVSATCNFIQGEIANTSLRDLRLRQTQSGGHENPEEMREAASKHVIEQVPCDEAYSYDGDRQK